MDVCSFNGNSDAYGLGIRLGLYIQWFTTLFVSLLAPEQCENYEDVNLSFMISILLALIYLTATRGDTLQSGSLYAVEACILLMLCMIGEFAREMASIGTRFVRRSEKQRMRTRRGVLMNTVFLAVSIYGVWFYSSGIYRMTRASCGDKIFLFKRLDLFGPFRIVALIIHSIMAIAAAAGILFFILDPSGDRLGKIGLGRPRQARPVPLQPQETTGREDILQRQAIVLLVLASAILIWGGAMIEVTIKCNHIQGVQSVNNTGQLIPLVIGSMGFILPLLSLERKDIRQRINNIRALVSGQNARNVEGGASPDSDGYGDKETGSGASQPEDGEGVIQPADLDASEPQSKA